ncbi:ATP-dependent RNA helicase [Acrasis kona]|uniref:RNA helicase n=1 Tax=Acrasis kona TaxID=1008807 RepID=A0AAW2YKW8_9EUKA
MNNSKQRAVKSPIVFERPRKHNHMNNYQVPLEYPEETANESIAQTPQRNMFALEEEVMYVEDDLQIENDLQVQEMEDISLMYDIEDVTDPFILATENFSVRPEQTTHFTNLILRVKESNRHTNHNIPAHIYDRSFVSFQTHFFTSMLNTRERATQTLKAFKAAFGQNTVDKLMWQLYLRDALTRYEGLIMNYNENIKKKSKDEIAKTYVVDLTHPEKWYPQTRKMRRQIIFHTGPTNSGKTHSAFQALLSAKTGVYAAPLRLLAAEVHQRMVNDGVKCDLITGDYKVIIDGATHAASTIEMLSTTEEYEVAVIDEVQLLSDPNRGWAWTRALLGIRAKEVHVCGEERTLQALKKIAADCGDDLIVNQYNRLTQLTCQNNIVRNIKELQPGDCVIAFGRNQILKIKNEIEQNTRYKVAVVFGGLPPSTRIQQATLFNSPDTKYDILVASDAIGHGLNLNIRRIIFHKTKKFDGTVIRELEVHEIKQIAGRAGRFRSKYPDGYVTTFSQGDQFVVSNALQTQSMDIEMAGLLPTNDQLEYLAHKMNTSSLIELLGAVEALNRLDDSMYFLCGIEPKIEQATVIDEIDGLNIREKLDFLLAPVQLDDQLCMNYFRMYMEAYQKGTKIGDMIQLPNGPPGTIKKMLLLESTHKILEMYCWLSYRYEDVFTQRKEAELKQKICADLIAKGLEVIGPEEKEQWIIERDFVKPKHSSRKQRIQKIQKEKHFTEKQLRNLSTILKSFLMNDGTSLKMNSSS